MSETSRCCGGSSCACLIQAGAHIQANGSGTSQDPFVLVGDVSLTAADNSVFNMNLSGLGTAASPWAMSVTYAATALFADLPQVNAATPTNNQVLGWDTASSRWTARAPTTATPGAVAHDSSLSGDGSSGTPLAVVHDPAGFTASSSSGVKLSTAGINSIVRHFTSTTTRAAASPAPTLNALSVLDTKPGEVDYWNGVSWRPVNNGVTQDYSTALLNLSGAYLTDDPTITLVRQVSATTDAGGVFEVIGASDLATASGVVSVLFQETGTVGYKAVVNTDINRITATAYSLVDGSALAYQAVTGTAVATVY